MATHSKATSLEVMLEAAGFAPLDGQAGLWEWRGHDDGGQTQTLAFPTSDRARSLWTCRRWVIRTSGETWNTVSLRFTITRERLTDWLQETVRQAFGGAALVEVVAGTRQDQWLLVEFMRPRSKHLVPLSVTSHSPAFHSPHGVGGLRLTVGLEKGEFLLQTADPFAIGYAPSRFFFQIQELLARAIGGDWETMKAQANLFESRIGVAEMLEGILRVEMGKREAARLFAAASDVAERFKSFGVATARVTQEGWDLALEEEGREATPFHPPVIEVLEARELGAPYQAIDRLILDGDWDAAEQAMKQAWDSKGPSLFVLRRMALLHLSGRYGLEQEMLDQGLNAEPMNKLFLSATIKKATTHAQKHAEDLLAAVSRLGELVYGSILDAEQMKTLEVVLPEFLGDCWFTKDPKMAQACYERVIAKRGDQPRILTKMAVLAHNQGLRAQEISVLKRLVLVERRKLELGTIYLRLAQLHQGMDPDEVVKHAIQALAYGHDNLDAVNLVCETLIQGGRPTEAIQVLTETLTRLDQSKDNRRKAELEIAIGEIWETYLGRKDLARERYTRALALADAEPVLRRLVDIFRTLDDKVHLAQSMREIVTISLENGTYRGGDAVEQLTQLYLDELHEPTQALRLFRDLNRAGVLTAIELTRLLAWPQFAGEWEEFYRELTAREVVGERGERIEWETLLGDVARRKLDDDDRAIGHYMNALKIGGLDRDNFTFLQKKLKDGKRHPELVEALRHRLAHVPSDERWDLLKEIVRYPKHLGDEEADAYAFLLMLAPKPSTDFFRARLDHYRDGRDPMALARLATQVNADLVDRSLVAARLEDVLERLEGMSHPRKFEASAKVLEFLKNERGETVEFLERALTILAGAPERSAARGYLMRLIELRRKPSLPKAAVLDLLKDSNYHQAVYFGILLEHMDPDGVDAVATAREAWAVLRIMSGMDAEKIAALGILARQGQISREELGEFRETCMRLGRFSDLKDALECQLDFASDNRDMSTLLHSLIEIEWFHNHDLDAALELYQRLVLVAEDPLKVYAELAEFAVRNASESQALTHVLAVWQQPDLHRRAEYVLKAMDWLDKVRMTKARLSEVVLPVVERMLATGAGRSAVETGRALLNKGIASPRTAAACLQDVFQSGNDEEAQRVFHDSLAVLRDAGALSEFLNASLKIFTVAERRPVFEQLLLMGISDGFPVTLPGRTEVEIKYFLGRLYYDENRQTQIAVRLFRELFLDNGEDVRFWEPYHNLLKKLDERDEAVKFLAKVIPMIKSGEVSRVGMKLNLVDLEREWLISLGGNGGNPIDEHTKPNSPPALPETPGSNVVALNSRAFSGPGDEPQSMSFKKVVGDSFATPEPPRPPGDISTLHVVPHSEKSSAEDDSSIAARNESSSRPFLDDWRRVVGQLNPRPHFTQAVFDKAFPSEREKHVALQAVAVLNGEAEPLSQWQHRVWRDFDALPYPLDFKSRLTNEEVDGMLANDLARLIAVLTPGLVYYYRPYFSVAALAKKLKQPTERVLQAAKVVPWEDELFTRSGLHFHAREFIANRMRASALPGIGSDIFYDAMDRVLYFDPRHYQKQPPSHLRHRMLWTLRAVRLNFYYLLALDPIEHLVPFLTAARNSLERKGLDAVKVTIGLARDPVGPALQKVEKNRLRFLFRKVERLSKRDLVGLVDAMNLQVYRMNFAETLDLVGIAEEVLDADLFRGSNRDWPERVLRSDILKGLLVTATRLKLD